MQDTNSRQENVYNVTFKKFPHSILFNSLSMGIDFVIKSCFFIELITIDFSVDHLFTLFISNSNDTQIKSQSNRTARHKGALTAALKLH